MLVGGGTRGGTLTLLSSPPGAAPLAARRPGLDIIVYCKLAMRHYSIDDVLPRAAPRHRAESRHAGPRRGARRGRGIGVWGGDLGTSGAPQVCWAALDAARERGRRGNRYHY